MGLRVVHLHSPLSLMVSGEAVTVAGSDSLGRAGRVMRQHNVSALLVDGGRAIVSERDLARALTTGLGPEDPVSAVATLHPVTVSADMAIVDAAALMLNEEIRHLAVELPRDRLGVVSLRAVLAVLLQAARPELWLDQLRLQVSLRASDLWTQ